MLGEHDHVVSDTTTVIICSEIVAVKELLQEKNSEARKEGLQEGLQEGLKDGMAKGELIGEIRLAQRMLKRRLSPKTALVKKDVKALKTLVRQLEAELSANVRA